MNRRPVLRAVTLDTLLRDRGALRIATAGMLPPFVYSADLLTRLCATALAGERGPSANAAAQDIANIARQLGSHHGPCRELIETATLRDLVSGGLVHRAAWRLRITARQAAEALDVLCDRLQRDERYELALCRDPLPFSFVLAGDRHQVCIDQHAPRLSADDHAGGFRSRSDDLLGAIRAEFDRLWRSPQTIRERERVLAHLRSQQSRIFTRVIL